MTMCLAVKPCFSGFSRILALPISDVGPVAGMVFYLLWAIKKLPFAESLFGILFPTSSMSGGLVFSILSGLARCCLCRGISLMGFDIKKLSKFLQSCDLVRGA